MATYLDAIVAHHRAEATADRADLEELARRAESAPPVRGFADHLRRGSSGSSVAVIAEIKRRSPSKGDLAHDLDPSALAKDYERAGASAVSVLTDAEYFGGSVADFERARSSCNLPVLRKDFTVCLADVYAARIMGADALLLITAALDDAELRDFHECAQALGLDVLVEVHDETELERALAIDTQIVGVNQRDLHTFAVDHERALRVGALIPAGVVRVAESGIRDHRDVRSLAQIGYHAVLVGEALVTAVDPHAALSELRTGAEPTIVER